MYVGRVSALRFVSIDPVSYLARWERHGVFLGPFFCDIRLASFLGGSVVPIESSNLWVTLNRERRGAAVSEDR
jgi:acyl-ACP thioesterase